MSPLLLALTLCASAPAVGTAEDSELRAGLDEGPLVDAVDEVLRRARDPVRLALPGVADADGVRRAALELALVRAVLARRREQVVTPATLRARLNAAAEAQALELPAAELGALSCDHVLRGTVLDQGGRAVLHLTLVHVETGEVLGEADAALASAGVATSAPASAVRRGVERVVEELAAAVEARGLDVRTQRVAVAAPRADGAAAAARLDRFVQAELSATMAERGFLVVERAALAAALDQLAVATALDEGSGPKVGKLLGADAILVGAISEAGALFLLDARLIDVERGLVLGAGSARLPRAGVVARADVETRTPLEAAARSLVAPGWGQAYNGDDAKALVFGVGGYGALVATVALAAGSIATSYAYDAVRPGSNLDAAQAAERTRALYAWRGALVAATAVAGGVTTVLWGGGIVDALVSAPGSAPVR
ncbi:MAG: hypothetical protein IT383_02585 [Deltaproteobacteria bacterium]|nr:hypothetical protein [Deltaproteobacteria bacterium]